MKKLLLLTTVLLSSLLIPAGAHAADMTSLENSSWEDSIWESQYDTDWEDQNWNNTDWDNDNWNYDSGDDTSGDSIFEDDTDWEEPVYVEPPYLEQSTIYLIKGGEGTLLEIENGTFSSGSSSDSKVAKIASDGMITPGKAGTAEIEITAEDSQGNPHTLYCTVYVTEYKLSEKDVKISLNQQNSATIYVESTGEDGGYNRPEVTCKVENEAIAYAYSSWDGSITIYGQKAGKTKLTVDIGGVTKVCKIEVVSVSLNKTSVQTYPGKKFTLKVKGTKDKVTWKSSNKKIATVSSKGVVTAKKNGTACITAKTKLAEVHCYVSVSNKKAISAVKKAQSVLGAPYSQAKRMQAGYYDCSSLVWRSLSPYGVYLGSRNWAPTAADQGKWCVQNKKVIAKKAIKTSSLKLQPGDLIFYRRDTENGRYKNIYHVAMFVGYEEYQGWFGGQELTGVIVDADGIQVSRRQYIEDYGFGKEIVLIARPY